MTTQPRIAPPARGLFALEGRTFAELGLFFQTLPWLRSLPKGDGHPVLVLPGFTTSDLATTPLRRYLRRQGYDAYGWALGRNLGPTPRIEALMMRRLHTIYHQSGRQVSLVGWSLGGIFARELARDAPNMVRQVITLGSPFAASPRATNVWRLFEQLSGQSVDELVEERLATMVMPPPVPSTAIYSKSDGVASWRACREQEAPLTDNVRVPGSHCGLGHNPVAVAVIADRLALPEDQWRRFDRQELLKRSLHRSLRTLLPLERSEPADCAPPDPILPTANP